MSEDNREVLKETANKLGVGLDERQIEQFIHFKDLLLEWNEKMNLTAITDEREIIVKHFADSLSLAPFLGKGTLIDVGTGAGFPGVPLKIALPNLDVTLLDSLNKRLVFVNVVIEKLGLGDVKTIHSRAEDGVRKGLREEFDYATARAVSRLSVLSEYCLPYVKVGGTFIAYKGSEISDEIEEATKALKLLGGEIVQIKKINFQGINHSLIMIKKVRQTPSRFPRTPVKITQNPIK